MDPGAELSRLIARQLGREPAIAFRVERECPFGWPAVLMNEPYTLSGKPNPNIYYLSCPYLRRELARLEDAGFIGRLENKISRDSRLAEDLHKAQEAHREEWLSLAGRTKSIRGGPPRIAAAKDDLRLKCLHAHFAWHLVHGDYLAGKLIVEELEQMWCSDDMCRRLAEQ